MVLELYNMQKAKSNPSSYVANVPNFKHYSFCLTHADVHHKVKKSIQSFIDESNANAYDYSNNYMELTINCTQLYKFPELLFTLTWLQKLTLNYHKLQTISDRIGDLINLQYLSLEHNRIASLPATIGNLYNLKTLLLNYNKLKSLEHIGML